MRDSLSIEPLTPIIRQFGRWLTCVCAVSFGLFAGCQYASAPATNTSPSSEARAVRDLAAPEPATNFDYYLLTLSWAPEYCHGHRNSPECDGTHPGFVVHGLWPQMKNGQWPSNCSTAPGLADPSIMLDIMPDPRLIAHEWATHGTCSGLTADQYFSLIRKAYDSVRIPNSLKDLTNTTAPSASNIKQLFTNANPNVSAEDIAISCHNRYLSAVEFCLSKDLQPIACQAVRDCNARSITVPSGQ